MGHHRTRRALMALLLLAPVLAFGGAASAFWSGQGGGNGSGATGTTVAVTLSVGLPTASLYPGGSANVVLTVSNRNVSPVHIGSLALDTNQGAGGFAVDAGHSGCSVAALSFSTQTNGGAGWDVAAQVGGIDGTLAVTLTNALAMSTDAANACQGVSTTVYLAAGP